MGASFDMLLWSLLSRSSCLTFGRECSTVIVWVMFTLAVRTVLQLLRIEKFIPRGFIFAFPLFMQLGLKVLPSALHVVPLLPVRLAQSLLGKNKPSNILILIPAHLLGAIIGVVCFRTLFPFIPNSVFEPITYQSTWWLQNMFVESLWNFFYVLIILTVPYIIEVNRVNKCFLSLPVAPFLLCTSPLQTSTFNPAIVYALWFLRGCSSMYMNVTALQIDRIMGPLLGAVFAAVICNLYFPDDANSWKRNTCGL